MPRCIDIKHPMGCEARLAIENAYSRALFSAILTRKIGQTALIYRKLDQLS